MLKLAIGEPAESDEKELADRVFIYIDKKTKNLKGFTIRAFKKRLIRLNFHEDIVLEEPPLSL